MHCLRCHLDIKRDDFIAHYKGDCICATTEPDFKADCPRCVTFNIASNPYYPRRGPAR